VDIDAVLERVDLNRQIERVDINAIVDKVDINALIERSNLDNIIARSSSGVFGSIVDLFRNKICVMDPKVQRMGRCGCILSRHKPLMLPPRPTSRTKNLKDIPCPSPSQMGLALQGRYAGFLPRALAFIIDLLLQIMSLLILQWFIHAYFTTLYHDWEMSDTAAKLVASVVTVVYTTAYDTICLGTTGRTIGHAIIGIKVVCANTGRPIGFVRAFLRTCLKPFVNLLLFGFLVSLVRRDGNTITDLVMCTGIIYKWDAKYALLRQNSTETIRGLNMEDADTEDEEAQYEE